jgi:hypothetical protein
LKDAFLAAIRSGKQLFYNTVVATAQKIEVANDTVLFTFLPAHRAMRDQFDQARPWLESTAERLAGRKIAVLAVQAPAPDAPPAGAALEAAGNARDESPARDDAAGRRDLKAEAMASSAVQAMLDVFPAEIRDVEEM